MFQIDDKMGDKGNDDKQTQAQDNHDNNADKGDDDQQPPAKASNNNKGYKGDDDQQPQAKASERNKTQTEYQDSPNRGAIRVEVFMSTVMHKPRR